MEDLNQKYDNVKQLFDRVIAKYYQDACACRYPRFLQIAGIDCLDYKASFMAWETILLIHKIKPNYDKQPLENGNEVFRELWTCKKCQSIFEFGYSDFSAAVSRQYVKPIEIKSASIGKAATQPIPLYIGLYGHVYPPKKDINPVSFEKFEKYMLELDE